MPGKLSRRQLLAVSAGTAAVAMTGVVQAQQKSSLRTLPSFDNTSFYDKNGKFDKEKAKDAVIALCEYHGYPVFPEFRKNLWVFDYGTGRYAELGLACYMFANHVAGPSSYMLSNLFLLPNQMLPEHWHEIPENKLCAQKDEGWVIYWGRSYVIGEGKANLPAEVVVPKCHCNGTTTVSHCTIADPGTFVPLAKIGTRHWQIAGKEGVILSEVANCHDDKAVRHTDPVCNEAFLNG